MPRDEELIGSYVGRDESPEIEMQAQESIGDALTTLFTQRGLYQKADLSFEVIGQYLKNNSKNDIAYFKSEFGKRPWVPVTPDLPKDNHMRSEFFCGIADSPLSTPTDEMKLTFPLPSIKMYCSKCKDEHTFSSVGVLWADGFMEYYPIIKDSTEQLFNFSYNCGICRDNLIGFLVKRDGLRLTLCGRTERLPVNVPKGIPKKLRPIVADAIGAANENDAFAGFYHLRTFCEHYMKKCIGMPIEEKITGDELSGKYNSSLDSRMTSGLPAISTIYEAASKLMHERNGGREEFEKLLSDIEGHLSAKELFERYATK